MHPACEGLDVPAFLLTPVQRMPRYVLLFKALSIFFCSLQLKLTCNTNV